MMNNEEIRQAISDHQAAIQESIEQSSGIFEFNESIAKHKKCIDELRKQCSHLNLNHEVQLFNGRCIYCGTRV